MKERPILFSGPMVRAVLDGTKTQTRRLVKPQPDKVGNASEPVPMAPTGPLRALEVIACPYGVPGDRLWVRETWHPCDGDAIYAADYQGVKCDAGVQRWHSPRFMPRVESRIDLEVLAVRVERLHDITEEDARAEGVKPLLMRGVEDYPAWMRDGMKVVPPHVAAFRMAWDELNGKRAAWSSNPWVWVVSFKRARP